MQAGAIRIAGLGTLSSLRSDRSARVVRLLATYALVGGLVTLAGWALDIPRLADWDSNGIAQMPNNALAVAAAGAALICASYGHRRTGLALGAFAGLIAVATLFEWVTGVDLGIDTVIFHREWGQRGTVSHGRMGLPGAVSISVIGVAIVFGVFGRLGRARRLATAGGLLTIGIGMLSLIGYLFEADPLYMIPRLTTIALQTTTMLLALGGALVASVPERTPMRLLLGESSAGMLVRRALSGVIVLPLLLGWLQLKGQEAGLFDTRFGTALLVLTLIGLLVALLLWSASAIFAHEAALLENRDRLAAILGSITDAFMTCDEQWRLVFVNREAETLLGRPGSALAGQSIWDVLPAADDGGAHEPLRHAMAERTSVEYEVYYPSWHRWFVNRAYPTADGGLVLYSRDITERMQAEQAIRESEQKFSLLFDKTPLGAALARLPGAVFVDVNEAFANVFGFTREEMVGKTSLELGIHPDAAARAQMLDELERGGSLREVEMQLHTRTGEARTFLNDITKVEIGGVKHLLTTIQDITERKAAVESLRKSTEALVAADRMKDEFLATLSHELRTPLTAIVGWSHILLEGDLDKREQQIALEAIRASAKAQTQLIEDVLDVSRIVTGKMRLQRRAADLAALIEAATATVRPAAEAKRISLRLDLQPDLPRLFVDPERIQQVVWNLLSNAIKFSPQGSAVDVRLRAEDDCCVLEVIDEGPGISRDFLPHVFERFRQADSSASRSHAGLGIGLALTKDLLELHGGTISVESEEKHGSRFTVRLPLRSLLPADERDRARSPDARLDGVRVLYVDDREDARLLIGTMLKRCGAEVVMAGSADDAMKALISDSAHVVVTDLAMPGRDGYELLATIRADSRWNHLPVLALTAQAQTHDEEQAFVAGFQAFLRKPIESQALAAAIVRALGERVTAG